MERKSKMLNPMKLRDDEYKGFSVDLKHGKPVPPKEERESKKKLTPEIDLRSEDYKGF